MSVTEFYSFPKRLNASKHALTAESFTEATQPQAQETRNDVPCKTSQSGTAGPTLESPARGRSPLDSCQYKGLRAVTPERSARLPSGNAGAELRQQGANIYRPSAGIGINEKSELLNVKTLLTDENSSVKLPQENPSDNKIAVSIDPQIVTERGWELAKKQAKQRYIKTITTRNTVQTKAPTPPIDSYADLPPAVTFPARDAGSSPRRSSVEPLFVPQGSYADAKSHTYHVSILPEQRRERIFRRLTPDAKIKNYVASPRVSKGLKGYLSANQRSVCAGERTRDAAERIPDFMRVKCSEIREDVLAGDFQRGCRVPFCASVPSGRSHLVKAPKVSVAPVGVPVVQPPVKRSRLAAKSAAKSTVNAVKRIAVASN